MKISRVFLLLVLLFPIQVAAGGSAFIVYGIFAIGAYHVFLLSCILTSKYFSKRRIIIFSANVALMLWLWILFFSGSLLSPKLLFALMIVAPLILIFSSSHIEMREKK